MQFNAVTPLSESRIQTHDFSEIIQNHEFFPCFFFSFIFFYEKQHIVINKQLFASQQKREDTVERGKRHKQKSR